MDNSKPERSAHLSPERIAHLHRLITLMGLEINEDSLVLVDRAFIHRSFRGEKSIKHDNERLELLGDSVIGLVCTEFLLERYPEENEGVLSKMRATMVSRAVLGEVAMVMNLGEFILLGAGEERTGGRTRTSTLGSALEAVCGALYLHYPWADLRPAIVEKVLLPALEFTEGRVLHDYKSILQEWTQKQDGGLPEYRLVGEHGPDHDRVFICEAWLLDQFLGRGEGRRKKIAENEAAREAVKILGLESEPDSP